MQTESSYNDKVVRQFTIMTVVWGIVGMLVGLIIAAQLIWPGLNFDLPFLTYSRLRPLHTNAVIFAFGGSALFGPARALPAKQHCRQGHRYALYEPGTHHETCGGHPGHCHIRRHV